MAFFAFEISIEARSRIELIYAWSGAHLWDDKFDGRSMTSSTSGPNLCERDGAIEPSIRGAEVAQGTAAPVSPPS